MLLNWRKVSRLFICASLSLVISLSMITTVGAESLKELKAKRSNITKEINDLKKQRDSAIVDRNNTAYQAQLLDQDMENAQTYYDYYVDFLDWAYKELEILESELAQARLEYDEQFQAFTEHARYMNENDSSGLMYLDILLNSKSFNDLLNNAEIIKNLLDYDKTTTEELLEKKQLIEDKLTETEEYKKEIEILKIEQEAYMAEIEQKQTEKAQKLEEYYMQEEYFNQMIKDVEADDKSLENIIREAEAAELARQKAASGNSASTQTAYVGGVFTWPVPSGTRISSPFGNRKHPITKKNDFHKGIDIPAKSGNSIVAAGNGKVIFVGTQGSYGKLVIVDHGGGMSTAYAHCSSYVASVGQTVNKGDTIAKIGSTGQSTGPHLHFEVRKGGTAVNPEEYLKG